MIDTNVISEARKGKASNLGVQAFFDDAASRSIDLYLSVITIGELRRGVEVIRHGGPVHDMTRSADSASASVP